MKWDDSVRITILSAAIRYWMHMYYQKEPVISDETFDLMYRELERLEKKEGHVRNNSPTLYPGS